MSDLARRVKALENVNGDISPALALEDDRGNLVDPVTLAPLTEHQVNRIIAVVPDVDGGHGGATLV